jgi:cysteine-rich repeat protein
LFNPFSTANAVAGVEQCDDGNTILGDGCALSCRSETCGNAVTDALAGEVCDNGPSGTGGVAVCSGGVNAGLPCDGLGDIACPFGFCLGNQQNRFGTAGLGYSTGGSTFLCRTNCLGTNRCGDTITDQTEACDSGSIAASDCDGSGAPSAERCTTPRCGDGFTNSGAGEQCDFGAANMDFNSLCRFGTAALTDPCELPFCGDGITDTGLSPFFTETCDTGGVNASNCDGSNCTTATCGDGTLNAAHDPDGGGPATGEECEDSNTVNNDGCSNTCQLPECGDGITQAVNGEECDSTADDCSEGSAGNCLGCCFDGTVGAGFTDVADLLTTLIDCRLEALEALADCDSRLERLAARAKEKAEQAELFNAAGDPVKAEKFLERAHRRLAKLLAKLSNARVAANCAADLACIQANAENAQDLALNGIANL